jgi:peptide/nickel transport system substrate-binding protein
MLRRTFLFLAVLCACQSGGKDSSDESPALPSPAADRETKPEAPTTGDWLVSHSLSDPEQLNPLTSNDAAASEILQYILQSLLTRDPRSLELKPQFATARPAISADKLTYTFKLRRDVHFQDGRPASGEDVLFSIKAIKCPLVNAPFLRVYYNSVIDAHLLDEFTIQFKIKEPYFLNESVLGDIPILPRHYYDPNNLLKDVSLPDLGKSMDQLPPAVKQFADDFNHNFNRSPMGTGPYKFQKWETGRELTLVRDESYWGQGKEGVDQAYIDRRGAGDPQKRRPGRHGVDADSARTRHGQRSFQARV